MDRKNFLKNLGINLFTPEIDLRVKRDLPFLVGQMLVEARLFKGLTQTELAQKAGTTQSSIARYERGGTLASLKFLAKVAKALGTYLIPPKFGFFDEIQQAKTESKLSSSVSFNSLRLDQMPYVSYSSSVQIHEVSIH